MAASRLVLAATLLLAGVAGAAYVAWSGGADAAGDSAAYPVQIVGPDGAALYDGVVRVENATALSALQAAASEAGLALVIEEYPGMGAYVRAIGPHEAHGASGWIYELREGDGPWVPGDRSAGRHPLHEGMAMRWRWTDG